MKSAVNISSWVKTFALVLGVAIFGRCPTAFSEPLPKDSLKEQAQQQFTQGEALFAAGDYEAAAAAFTRAYEILPHYAVLANIGLAYERFGAYPSAVIYLRKYLTALAEQGKSNPKVEAVLRETLKKVSEIVISAEGFREDHRILLDDVDQGASPVQVVVQPGEHHVQVVIGGEIRVSDTLSVAPGESRRYTLSELTALQIQKTVQVEKPGMGAPFWVMTASALAAGVAAGALWGVTFKTKKLFDQEQDIDEKRRLGDKGENLQLSAAITTGVAGTAAITAVVLGIVRAASSEKSDPKILPVAGSNRFVGICVRF